MSVCDEFADKHERLAPATARLHVYYIDQVC